MANKIISKVISKELNTTKDIIYDSAKFSLMVENEEYYERVEQAPDKFVLLLRSLTGISDSCEPSLVTSMKEGIADVLEQAIDSIAHSLNYAILVPKGISGAEQSVAKLLHSSSALERASSWFLDPIKKFRGSLAAAVFSAYILPYWMRDTLLFEDKQIEGTPVEERAFANLFWLTLLVNGMISSGMVTDEFAELFFEGLSDALSEIFEKLFKGSLEVKTNLLIGHEPMDDDEIKDIASTGLLSIDYLGYLGVLAGLFNSAAYSEVLTGMWYNREDTMNHVRDSALYHVVQWDERAAYMHEYKMDAAREILRDAIADVRRVLRKYIMDYVNSIRQEITVAAVDRSTLEGAKRSGHISDSLILQIKQRHIENLDAVKNKYDYVYDAKEQLSDALGKMSLAYDSMLEEYARDKAIIIQQYVARLDASVRELWEQAKRLAIIIYRYRRMDMAKVRF